MLLLFIDSGIDGQFLGICCFETVVEFIWK